MKYLKYIGLIVIMLFAVAVFIIFIPSSTLQTTASPYSYPNYEAAIADIKNFDEPEKDEIREECTSRVYSTGKKEVRTIILWHGYTNCPKQFDELGQRLFAKGYNVLIPRVPGHGYQDRMTEALGTVTFEDFRDFIQRSVAIGNMLGDKTTVVGLSGGGTFALWSALYEKDVDRVIAIAPVAYPRGFEPYLREFVIKYASFMPNEFKWWNDEQKGDFPGPPYAYRRYSSKSMGIVLHMASTVEQALKGGMKLHGPITFVINEADQALRDKELLEISNLFEKGGAEVTRSIFEQDKGYPHDLIDAHNIKEHKEDVYKVILELIG